MKLSMGLGFLASTFATSVLCDSTCPPQAVGPKPTALHCGANLVPSQVRGSRSQIGQPTTGGTALECVESCFGDSTCQSLTFDTSSTTCTIYKSTGKRMGLVKATASTTRFYSKTCFYIPDSCTPAYVPYDLYMQVSAPNTEYDAQYAYVLVDNELNNVQFTSDLGPLPDLDAAIFQIQDDGSLTNDLVAVSALQVHDPDNDIYFYSLYFPTSDDDIEGAPTVPITCSVDASHVVTCSSDAGNVFYGCQDGPYIDYRSGLAMGPAGSTSSYLTGCDVVAISAVPVNTV